MPQSLPNPLFGTDEHPTGQSGSPSAPVPPSCRRTRAVMWRMFAFALTLLVPLAAGEAYLRHLPNPSKDKHAYLIAHAPEVDVLILGSSHTYYGVAPELLSPHAYSAAQVSQTLRYDDWVLHHYDFRHLTDVVVPISYFTFYEELEGGGEWYLANRYRLYMDCDLHPRLSVYDWEVTAFSVYITKLKSLWQPRRMWWSREGQGLEYTTQNKQPDWDNGAVRAARNHYTDFSGAPANESRLRHIADYCRRHHVRLWLITTPLRPSFRQACDGRQLADTRHRLQVFMRRYPEVHYIDYGADPRFSAQDFYDADHLSLTGSHRLTKYLREDMAKIGDGSE